MASKTEGTRLTPKLISLAVAACFSGAAHAQAVLPTGAHAMTGVAGINTVGSAMTVTTNASRSIANWQTFSIGSGATVNIQQPGVAASMLNRVVGSGGAIDPSVILGTLQSNGRVFLINPSGIVFGAGAQVDVAGLVASSLNLSNSDFLGGRMRFTEAPGAGAVVNQGTINAAAGGQVYLVGSSVTNSGVITSPKGEVILAAGNSVELVNPGTPNLRVEITAPDNEARNLGSIVADAGRVGIYAGLINHSGTTRADSAVATEDGRIVLRATKNTTVEAGSTISASGPSGGQITIQSGDTTLVSGAISATGSAGKGGTVQVLGNLVGLIGNASIDVSGEAGGGTALVGGGFQGKNPNVQNAFRTYFGPNAMVRADAIGNGDGGTVIVWSDNATRAYGTISARGGSRSGDGGLVEVSSKGWLDFHARVDTRAPKGRAGTLLLDPTNVEIFDCGDSCSSGGDFDELQEGSFVWTSDGTSSPSRVDWLDIEDNLNSGNVIITTGPTSVGSDAGNITVLDSYSYNSSNLLQLVAHNDVNVNGSITNTGIGAVSFYAGWDGVNPIDPTVSAGIGNIGINANVQTDGNVLLRAGLDINVASGREISVVSNLGSRMLTLHAGNKVNLNHSNLTVDVSGGEGASALIKVRAGTGGVTVDGGEGISMLAKGSGICCGGPVIAGGNSTIEIGNASEPITGPVIFRNGAIIQSEAGYGKSNPGGESRIDVFTTSTISVESDSRIAGFGGQAGGSNDFGGGSLVQLVSGGDINILNSRGSAGCFSCGGSGVISVGNFGGMGGGKGELTLSAGGNINANSAFIGAEGRSGGAARITAAANGVLSVINNSLFRSEGGRFSAGGTAEFSGIAGSVNVSGSQVQAIGGDADTASGGNATLALKGTGNSILIGAGSQVSARGGSASSSGAGSGGESILSLESPTGPVTVSQSTVSSTGGSGPSGGGGTLVIGGTGLLSFLDGVIEGGELDVNAALAAVATGPVSLTGASVSGVGGQGFQSSGGSGGIIAMTTGQFSMQNSSVHAVGGPGVTAGGDGASIVVASNILIESTSPSSPTTLVANGGLTSSSSGLLGSGAALLGVLGPTGELRIVNERVDVSGGQRGSGPGATFGPGSIFLLFPNRLDGGFFVNGVEGAITGSPVGFFVNGQPAIPGTNFFTFYGGLVEAPSPPPTFDAQLIASMFSIFENMQPKGEDEFQTNQQRRRDGPGDCR